MVKEGGKAPAFTLESDNGGEVSLADLQGKKVVLYFYPRDNTPGCTLEAQGFRDAAARLKKKVFPKVKVAGHVDEVLAAL